MTAILGTLRVGLHVMFALLLFFGVLRAAMGGQLTPVALGAACALGVVYLSGTVWERRRVLDDQQPERLPQLVWLAAITALWLVLLLHSPDFLWIQFPLVFLYLHLLPGLVGYGAATAIWAVAAFLPALTHADSWHSATAVGPAIGTVFAMAIYAAYQALAREALTHRRIAQELRATQAELAAREHQAGRLEERERLSREIHDTVAQGLSSIVLLARAAKNSNTNEQVAQQLQAIEAQASDNLAEARRFVADLSSPEAGLPLKQSLDKVIAQARERANALGEDVTFELVLASNPTAAVPDSVTATCIRFAQEGLNNVAKHAQATHAVVTLGHFGDVLTLDIADNGRGMPRSFSTVTTTAPATPADQGYGLRGLAQRIASHGGTMEIDSLPGEGTTLSANIPLHGVKENQHG